MSSSWYKACVTALGTVVLVYGSFPMAVLVMCYGNECFLSNVRRLAATSVLARWGLGVMLGGQGRVGKRMVGGQVELGR